MGLLREHLRRAGGGHPQGFCSPSQRVFITSLSNLVNMLVCIMSRPSSITSQNPPGTPELWPFNCPKLGFLLSKSKSFCPAFIKLGEYVGGHNIMTNFYNQPNLPCTPELLPLNCPKLGFMLSKSKSFHPVFIKLGEYVGGHNIMTKFYNLPNPLRHSWIMALELSKNWISSICSPRAHFVLVWHSCLNIFNEKVHNVLLVYSHYSYFEVFFPEHFETKVFSCINISAYMYL